MLTTDKFNIKTLLKKIKCGEIQLPDFQRDWVWKDKQIQSLLESVIRGFPINSILLLECDTNNIIKDIISIIFRNNATDFRLGKVIMISANHNENIDVHHIFPKQTPVSSDTKKSSGASHRAFISKTLKLWATRRNRLMIRSRHTLSTPTFAVPMTSMPLPPTVRKKFLTRSL